MTFFQRSVTPSQISKAVCRSISIEMQLIFQLILRTNKKLWGISDINIYIYYIYIYMNARN